MTDAPKRVARKKRRSFQQLMEERSGVLLRGALPPDWVLHAYGPDYGIDGTVEVFAPVADAEGYVETLGETFLFQLKSVKCCEPTWKRIPHRRNIEKGPYLPSTTEFFEAEVIPFTIDTDELLTIEAMGAGIAVLLFLVCLESERVFFLSLTDLVDKVLTPESPDWREQASKVVHVPFLNLVKTGSPLLRSLRFYGARPKLMALFSRIHFQWAELAHPVFPIDSADWESMALHFTRSLLRLDAWEQPAWAELLDFYRDQLVWLEPKLAAGGLGPQGREAISDLWYRMDALARTYEEICREWFLPTWIGHEFSYPDSWFDASGKAKPLDERH